MGDVLFALSILSDIKANLPKAEIDWVVDQDFQGLVREHEGIVNTIGIPLRAFSKSLNIVTKIGLLGEICARLFTLRKKRYDVLIDTQGVIKSALVSLLSRSQKKWGYQKAHLESPALSRIYTDYWEPTSGVSAVLRYRLFVGYALGYTPDNERARFQFKFGLEQNAEPPNRKAGGQRFALVVPFSAKESKQLGDHPISLVLRGLIKHGFQISLVAGSEREREQSRMIAELAECSIELIYRPMESFSTFARRLTEFDICIGVDTGIIHVAAAYGVPTIGIFSASGVEIYGPHLWAPNAQSIQSADPELISKIEEVTTKILIKT